MSVARKVLLIGGFTLAALGMLYGLHYALFVEHQTLDRMGGTLQESFIDAAQRRPAEAHAAVDAYAATKYAYVREVDLHSHWIGLAMLLIVLGIALDYVAFSDRMRTAVAIALLAGSFLFPLGVILQTVSRNTSLASALAIFGSATVTIALAAVVWGFWRFVP
jgi:dipeptide/tripeptide permease